MQLCYRLVGFLQFYAVQHAVCAYGSHYSIPDFSFTPYYSLEDFVLFLHYFQKIQTTVPDENFPLLHAPICAAEL